MGIIFKNNLIGTIIIAVYSLFLNSIGKYDLNNVLKELAKKIFDFYGVINIGSTFAISTGECILVIGIIILFCLITSIVIVQKRSSFIS